MSADKKIQEEDLKELEDQAYFELLQIIAEAMELQSLELLDSRIAMWKSKYKKLLDRPSTSSRSDFKKRIEFLLTTYYSSVTLYILGKLKLNEEEKVQNQAKALKELYRTIKETNDLDLLREKVKEWKEKYPISGFLKMYQKRIESYTRDKNLRENAFEQEKAFSDLVDITKENLTLDELNIEISNWEKEYSINDKYTIDDFLKHQSEVKRYTSPEFLQSIARDEPSNLINENTGDFSNLSTQKNAYDNLMTRINGHNSIDKVFEWVYKNRYIKFNDRYKEMILSATYLDYRPQYLRQLSEPKMDMSMSSLSFEEYNNIDEIKRYAVLSYFNMLLPSNMAIPNDYFEKNILTVYYKSEKARVSNDIKPDLSSDTLNESLVEDTLNDIAKVPNKEGEEDKEIIIDLSNAQEVLSSDLGISQSYKYNPEEISTMPKEKTETNLSPEKQETEIASKPNLTAKGIDKSSEIIIKVKERPVESPSLSAKEDEQITDIEPEVENIKVELNDEPSLLAIENIQSPETDIVKLEVQEPESDISTNYSEAYKTITENKEEKSVIQEAVITLSPFFFEAVNRYKRQADLINVIDGTVTKYIERQEIQERQENLSLNQIEKKY